ncbi:phosphotransacetylase family protein [Halostagnicola sp. A-GB9-2]|uniref:phosphotransacetylase family protein n=1 Tax=Halostagnicola sp. A-GB9-2 TaxID=3048066 RepID=UPI0024BF4D91|nr:phosphotransacetylase family protein [Halostagnicola sp. A-GB9-2]MDJ1433463.1 phosphotransacetylase family protein [Halostagnicola sp. A-GB9-2]
MTDTDTTPDSDTDTRTETEALLISSLEASTGKTAIALALARLAHNDSDGGEAVGYMKPKGTRLESNVGKTLDEDPFLARELLEFEAEIHDMEPIVYSPTFVEQVIRGREDPDELRERVLEAYETLAADCDRLFVEGGGNLDIGGIIDLTDADIAELLDARVLLVASYESPGDVDRVITAARTFGDRLDGVLFNNVSDAAYDELDTDVVPFLDGNGISTRGILPREQTLAGVTVNELTEALGATMLAEDGSESYVERFTVGAMGAESALRHFRRTKNAAVITGGDRSEIHTAALEAPGVRCLILTGGHRPSGAIIGQATERGIPILAVQTDTLTTVERAEDIVRSGRTRSERTVEEMESLLTEYADIEHVLETRPEE